MIVKTTFNKLSEFEKKELRSKSRLGGLMKKYLKDNDKNKIEYPEKITLVYDVYHLTGIASWVLLDESRHVPEWEYHKILAINKPIVMWYTQHKWRNRGLATTLFKEISDNIQGKDLCCLVQPHEIENAFVCKLEKRFNVCFERVSRK